MIARVIAVLVASACAYQAPRSTLFPTGGASIQGIVLDSATGEPLEASFVKLSLDSARSQSIQTGRDGAFGFSRLPHGVFSLKAGHIQYYPSQRDVRVDADSIIKLTIRLRASPVE